MKQEEYIRAIDNTPQYSPVFEVIRVPKWAIKYGVKVGDRNDKGAFRDGCAIQPSYLKFIGYRQIPRKES